MKEVFIEKN